MTEKRKENGLRISSLSFSYGKRKILEEVSFSVEQGELCVLLGANGAGKSTMVKCINGLYRPEKGRVWWQGRDTLSLPLKERARIYGYVPQSTQAGGGLTVMETVLSGRLPHRGGAGRADGFASLGKRDGNRDVERAAQLLEEFGLAEFAFRSMEHLSGGERQRVLIARAMAQEPEVVLLDEPTSNLDLRYQYEVMELLRRVSRERGMTVVAVIHDLNLALDYGDRAVVLGGGRVLAEGPPGKAVTAQVIEEAYGVRAELADVGGRTVVLPSLRKGV